MSGNSEFASTVGPGFRRESGTKDSMANATGPMPIQLEPLLAGMKDNLLVLQRCPAASGNRAGAS
jgi:hypothetical protein